MFHQVRSSSNPSHLTWYFRRFPNLLESMISSTTYSLRPSTIVGRGRGFFYLGKGLVAAKVRSLRWNTLNILMVLGNDAISASRRTLLEGIKYASLSIKEESYLSGYLLEATS